MFLQVQDGGLVLSLVVESIRRAGLGLEGYQNVEARISEALQEALIAKGHKLTVSGPWSKGALAIIVDPDTGVLSAGADPRVEAYA